MPKLNVRQGVILAVMFIVILYGAYSWLGGPDIKKIVGLGEGSQEKQVFITTLTSGLDKEEDSVKVAYAVFMAESQWWNDPFLDKAQYIAWSKAKEAETVVVKDGKIGFTYTGFVETKGKRMAIINGDEYASGEKLTTNRHVLKSVNPMNVIIKDLTTGQDMTVPFQE